MKAADYDPKQFAMRRSDDCLFCRFSLGGWTGRPGAPLKLLDESRTATDNLRSGWIPARPPGEGRQSRCKLEVTVRGVVSCLDVPAGITPNTRNEMTAHLDMIPPNLVNACQLCIAPRE